MPQCMPQTPAQPYRSPTKCASATRSTRSCSTTPSPQPRSSSPACTVKTSSSGGSYPCASLRAAAHAPWCFSSLHTATRQCLRRLRMHQSAGPGLHSSTRPVVHSSQQLGSRASVAVSSVQRAGCTQPAGCAHSAQSSTPLQNVDVAQVIG